VIKNAEGEKLFLCPRAIIANYAVMAIIGFYPGSFDPVTNGHVDIIARASKLFDRLVVGVGVHHGKEPLFSWQERVSMLKTEISELTPQYGVSIEVVTFTGLTVHAAQAHGAAAIVRGLRDGADFDYEMLMSGMNGVMAPSLDTVFLASSPDVRHIASKFVRQIAAMGGDISPFVPASIAELLRTKLAGDKA
jgi:pantetheine-phosphate adenylyltransferase